jgi:hypothetical protein
VCGHLCVCALRVLRISFPPLFGAEADLPGRPGNAGRRGGPTSGFGQLSGSSRSRSGSPVPSPVSTPMVFVPLSQVPVAMAAGSTSSSHTGPSTLPPATTNRVLVGDMWADVTENPLLSYVVWTMCWD